mgnify:CR=1 FL=1
MKDIPINAPDIDPGDVEKMHAEPRLITVQCPDSNGTVKINEDKYKQIRKEEVHRFSNFTSQSLNYLYVIHALLSRAFLLMPTAMFYVVIFSLMASDLTSSNPYELLLESLPVLPYLLIVSVFVALFSVLMDFFFNPRKYCLRDRFSQAIFRRASNHATL